MLRLEGLNLSLEFSYDHGDSGVPYVTECRLSHTTPEDDSSGFISEARAYASPHEKRVVKEKGRKVALRRAMENASWGRSFRTLVWHEYFSNTGKRYSNLHSSTNALG